MLHIQWLYMCYYSKTLIGQRWHVKKCVWLFHEYTSSANENEPTSWKRPNFNTITYLGIIRYK